MIPVGGAGLIAGMALAIKTLRPNCLVIGVEPAYCASYTEALKMGKPSPAAVSPTLGDGLAVPTVGPHSFEVARKYVDKVVTVSEKYLALAILRCLEHGRARTLAQEEFDDRMWPYGVFEDRRLGFELPFSILP